MRVGEYLFNRLKALGVRHIFGIPGDFALPLYQALERTSIRPIVVTHEPAAGFAADAYARLKGLGVTVVTFGAGALNMVNSIAQAYAERSPVLVVSGAPEIHDRSLDALVHHKVRTFESQLAVYREITCAAAALNDPRMAMEEIDRVLEAVLRWKRPGYLEIPRDVVFARGARSHRVASTPHRPDPDALREVMAEVAARLNQSRRPVIYAGVEIERFGLIEKLVALAEKFNLPVVTSMDGKAVFPETHRNFVGIYMGKVGSAEAREVVENSDCVLMLGAFMTDVSTGLFTAQVDRATLMSASSEEVSVSHHRYPGVTLVDLVEHLLASRSVKRHALRLPRRAAPSAGSRSADLTTRGIVEELNAFLTPGRFTVVADVGDCMYACVDLRTDTFLGPGYYNSMGFAVPAAIAAELAWPKRRAIALVGDGGFQMTGMELGTAKAHGLRPIVILFNNGGFATMQAIAGRKDYFTVAPWDYVRIAESLGGRGAQVRSREGFRAALKEALDSRVFFLIEAILSPADISPTWTRIADEVRSRLRMPAS
ncbi:MAG: thiamine pyrophosphate-binding protein [candidate division NC10 bacterium]|nr:thiamine pyrophosphate-binding protein [candidate division NC10 bacterium]